ncbi:hypothetical protein ACLUXD_05930 [Loigolactobacillus coryniformis subsp. coryniformis]|uniref:hypothetical protein n=1 Tax=Loigolactobacillus coryniformis TaxID=1610 RepID=UPI0039953444
MKYVISHALPDKQDASVKAHTDIDRFLGGEDYKILTFATRTGGNRFSRQIHRLFSIRHLAKTVTANDSVVVQYPVYSSDLDTDLFYNRVVSKAKQKIAIVHDLPFLRDSFPPVTKVMQKELQRLNLFNTVIVHNEAMQKKLVALGIETNIVTLGLFDYYTPKVNKIDVAKSIPTRVLFAGNLTKSSFVTKLKSNELVQYHLWGSVVDKATLDISIDYHGIVLPDELPQYLINGWGLVWDGNTTDTVSGLGGEYLRYIDPHKTSLYISSGIPVIVWQHAGVARFIQENNLGLVIESIEEIPERLQNLSQEQYKIIMQSVHDMQAKLVVGSMIKTAVNRAINS